MKKQLYLCLLAVGLTTIAACKKDKDPDPVPPANTVDVSATLNNKQQVPFNNSAATGTMTGTYNKDTKVLSYNVTYTGLTPVAGHIHYGRPGQNGAVAIPFSTVATSPITGTDTLTAAEADSLLAGKMYVNLHTTAFAGGEIRGNINMPTGMVLLKAVIDASQQVPTNSSTATGTFTGAYNPATKQLNYTVTYAGLTPSAAHIHRGAPGMNGTVAVPFGVPTASKYSGIATLPQATAAADESLLLNNGMYVNIHSATFGNGEIRGNIVKQ